MTKPSYLAVTPYLWPIGVLAVVCAVYWPVHEATFIWIDKKIFVFQDFSDWRNYFRPLVVGLIGIEARLFDATPEPAHIVSLVLHLANTFLVGMLALRTTPAARSGRIGAMLAMLLYGLHPALIESVACISCQFDLVVTFFILLGLWANSSIAGAAGRSVFVACCFFAAACAKESAVVFPVLLVILDWLNVRKPLAQGLRETWNRQVPVYASVFGAGVLYLVVRFSSAGHLLQPGSSEPLVSLQRFQTVCSLLLTYWRILVWPMVGAGPLHEVDTSQLASPSLPSIANDALAIGVLSLGVFLCWRRNAAGGLLLASTAALLPVLHVIPVDFDSSLYHERYATTSVAVACCLLPAAIASLMLPADWKLGAGALAIGWLAVAIVNVRTTVPLWSDEVKLWRWTVREHPDSPLARNHLLAAYLDIDDRAHARPIAEQLMADRRPCPMCLVNVATLALVDGDLEKAKAVLDRASPMLKRTNQPRLMAAFVVANGELKERSGDPDGGAADYRQAIALEPLDPDVRMRLALLLARQLSISDAEAEAARALALYPPDERTVHELQFRQAIAAALEGGSKPP